MCCSSYIQIVIVINLGEKWKPLRSCSSGGRRVFFGGVEHRCIFPPRPCRWRVVKSCRTCSPRRNPPGFLHRGRQWFSMPRGRAALFFSSVWVIRPCVLQKSESVWMGVSLMGEKGSSVQVKAFSVCQIADSVWIRAGAFAVSVGKSIHYRGFGARNSRVPAPGGEIVAAFGNPSVHFRGFGARNSQAPAPMGEVAAVFSDTRSSNTFHPHLEIQ